MDLLELHGDGTADDISASASDGHVRVVMLRVLRECDTVITEIALSPAEAHVLIQEINDALYEIGN